MRKPKASPGFTLTEMLFCIVILSVLALLAAAGFKATKRSLSSMEEQYRAGILAEHLLAIITEEFRYSRNLTIEMSEALEAPENESMKLQVSYTSDTYGENTILKIESSEPDRSYGYLTIINKPKGTKQEYYPYKSLYTELWICPLNDKTPIFQWDSNGEGIFVSFGICNEDGKIKASIENNHIRLLNPPDF